MPSRSERGTIETTRKKALDVDRDAVEANGQAPASDLLIVENLPARELVLRKLRNAILSGRFHPGQRLLERELVDLLGVSRTPIREAMCKLELEGLVTAVPYKGPMVTLPTVDEAAQLYEVRAALEGQAVALFAERANAARVDCLYGHIFASERALRKEDIRGVLTANNAFHDELAAGCGNPLLQSMLSNLRNRVVLMRVESLSQPARPSRSIMEHRAIVRMIQRHNAEGARRLAERHVMHAWVAARAQLASPGSKD